MKNKSMKNLLSFIIAVLCGLTAMAGEIQTVKSPDGKLIVSIENDEGKANYSITYNNKQILEKSTLGLYTNIGDFSTGLTLKKTDQESLDRSYSMDRTKMKDMHYVANVLNIYYETANKKNMTITFNVADNSVAYRYTLPMQGQTACVVVTGEASSFKFPTQTTTFICPQAKAMTGWMRSKPSYEEEYTADAKMDVKSAQGEGYTFPCLFHVGDNGWALVSETGTNSQYCGCHLSDFNPATGYSIAFPQQGENNGFGSNTASFALPGSTPWRTIVVGDQLKPIVESTVQFDVVDPLYEASQTYKPGRSTWSWIVWQDQSMNYNDQKTFIDLAHDMGFEYILMDALWISQVGRERMQELFKYAHSKGVDVFLWYNSNGAENDAPQDAKQCMSTSIARKAEMKWMKANGVKGIKVDFFGGDKQETMRLYEDILSDANEYGIQVIFHGCTLPRGWERMYPNYCASEAVLASENMIFNQHFDDFEGFQLTLHPFIRNTVGSMDWGGTFLNRHLARDNKGGKTRRTSDIFELAAAIVNQSSVQNIAITPNNLKEAPLFEINFLKEIPTTWDETRLVDGYPGKYVVLARRHGDKWYVAALNGTKETLKIDVDLPMLASKSVNFYNDSRKKDKEGYPIATMLKSTKIAKNGKMRLTIQPLGGAIINE
jgi:hypothetical protein